MSARKNENVTLNRAQRRAFLKPWRARKQRQDGVRRKAAFDIDLRNRVIQALKAKAAEEEQAQ